MAKRLQTTTGWLTVFMVLGVMGCGIFDSGSSEWNTALQISATYSVDNQQFVSAKIAATNRSGNVLEGSTNSCQWLLRVYDNPKRKGSPIWRTEDSPPFCRDIEFPIQIGPGQRFEFPQVPAATVAEILGGHAAGEYFVSAVLKLDEPTREFPAGSVVLEPR